MLKPRICIQELYNYVSPQHLIILTLKKCLNNYSNNNGQEKYIKIFLSTGETLAFFFNIYQRVWPKSRINAQELEIFMFL